MHALICFISATRKISSSCSRASSTASRSGRPSGSSSRTRTSAPATTLRYGVRFSLLASHAGLLTLHPHPRPRPLEQTDLYPRPSHADWTYLEKYGVKASSGGGRSSARETIGRVAAGAIAEKYLAERPMRVVLAGRPSPRLDDAARRLRDKGADVETVDFDAADTDGHPAAVGARRGEPRVRAVREDGLLRGAGEGDREDVP